jgi:hypothetical protein
LRSYHLLPASPLIDAGLDLHGKFGLNVGSQDFWGTRIPQGRAFDIGAFEAPARNGGKSTADLVQGSSQTSRVKRKMAGSYRAND